MKTLKIVLISLVVLLMVGILSNCGYRLSGFGNQVPEHVRSIFIPDFENKTTRFQADQYITFAVREEFIKRSRLRLEDRRSNADSLLEGKITRFTVNPLSYSENASANVYRVSITVSVRFIDLKSNEIIFDGEGISFNDTYTIESDVEIDDDFFSQETETLLKIAAEFAESVVTTILENF